MVCSECLATTTAQSCLRHVSVCRPRTAIYVVIHGAACLAHTLCMYADICEHEDGEDFGSEGTQSGRRDLSPQS